MVPAMDGGSMWEHPAVVVNGQLSRRCAAGAASNHHQSSKSPDAGGAAPKSASLSWSVMDGSQSLSAIVVEGHLLSKFMTVRARPVARWSGLLLIYRARRASRHASRSDPVRYISTLVGQHGLRPRGPALALTAAARRSTLISSWLPRLLTPPPGAVFSPRADRETCASGVPPGISPRRRSVIRGRRRGLSRQAPGCGA